MGRCTTRPRGREPTTRGFASSGSKTGRSRSCSTSATAECSTRRPGETRSTRRSPSSPRAPPYVDVVERLVCLRGVSTLTAFALTVELGDWNRFRPESLGPFLGLTPSENSSGERRRQGGDHQDRQHARAPAPDRGRLAPTPPTALERHARTQTHRQVARRASPSGPERPPAPRTLARARGPRQAPHDRRGRRRPRARRTLLGTRDDGVAATTNGSARRAHRRNDARSDPREHCEQPQPATLDARERHRSSSRTPGHAAPTRAYESRHRRRRQPMRSPRRTEPRKQRGRITLRG